MWQLLRISGLLTGVAALTGCMSTPNQYLNYHASPYDDRSMYYSEQYEGEYPYYQPSQNANAAKKPVEVPETYHVGRYHSPTSHKDRDRRWVVSQNPQAYTIEIAEGEKASQVAGKLFKAPKKDRMAQIKYQRGDRVYYEGVYGSYPSYEAAQQALSTLPDDLKQGAHIKSWGSVQNKVYQTR